MGLQGCCCFDLKTGASIIGTLDLIGSCYYLFSVLVVFVQMDSLLQAQASVRHWDLERFELVRHITVAVLSVLLVASVLSVIASSLLIHGIVKDKPGLMNFVLVKLGLLIGLLALCVLGSFVLMLYLNPLHALIVTLPVTAMLGVAIFFFRVVKSYKIQVQQSLGVMSIRPLETVDSYPIKR